MRSTEHSSIRSWNGVSASSPGRSPRSVQDTGRRRASDSREQAAVHVIPVVDGEMVGALQAQDTGDDGEGWNVFVAEPAPEIS